MIRVRTFSRGVALASGIFILAGLAASADESNGKVSLSGVWQLKMGENRIEFSDKNVVKIIPHGDNKLIAIVCEYAAERKGLVKAKITGIEGKAKEKAKDHLPVGTEFSFQWTVKDETATLNDLIGDKIEHFKTQLEGEYSQKK
jgi:hypothetical protein